MKYHREYLESKDDFITMLQNNDVIDVPVNLRYFNTKLRTDILKDYFDVSTSRTNNTKTIVLNGDVMISSNYQFIEIFDDFLKRNKMITKIKWNDFEMESDCTKRFNQLLINNKQIIAVEFNNSPKMTYDTVFQNVALQEVIIDSPYLLELPKLLLFPSIQSVSIKIRDMVMYEQKFGSKELLNAFTNTKSLTKIHINDGDREEGDDVKTFNDFIECLIKSNNQSVKELYLYLYDKLSKKICKNIKKYITQNKNIIKLKISIKSINNYGFLNKNSNIEELHIDAQNTNRNVIKSIEKLILTNRKITDLKIPFAPIYDDDKMLLEAIKKNGTIENIELDVHQNYYKDIFAEVDNIKKLKKQYVRTYLDLFAGYQIIPMINIINEYVGLAFTS
ncbi:MAG: hypothetical protein Edafosvirus6_52 [Edafosvirus sp.]|uniref:Uncharacterized protein n=1 Tax=Edafosvirus sp. TaxID=2487765 RepID=A0A3G4ZX91_9VIRU|nr:MAG: hypothetical protein Edafosvirus6_52 [Edafosvirus sp.]